MALVLAATPLGNPLDASARLKMAIESAEIIAAEDSRRFHRLASDLGVTFTARIISFFEGNESDRTQEILTLLREGKEVLVVTDAGMPTISDPGFRLMRDAIAEKLPTIVIPGPSAPTMAIALSGLPTDRFTFEGFAPRAHGARTSFYESLRFEERTMVIFEAPHRLHESLVDASAILGADRAAAICREMTKTYEETIRGPLSELIAWAAGREVLGEITLVIAGVAAGSEVRTADDAVARVREYEVAGMDRKGAIATVAEEFSIPKKIVYAAVVDANKMSR
ncbi:16S rRNA (cytidine1402-2'-O)-methyltransferase [Candidatus Planktophila versatilis]|uniref:Ribosomal RNA small subunit methyltransferase I n=1 Tax=Candidatus Planktophila versatilis TaxID=1884905 RepID=A0AAC9YWJ2_9ACTN|nr:16S rRNA (cytidine(1402)-2'-O)-methyltransferase [Candidatus Planktophila versatilis]ASY18095.1 16S rRNA (cytidine1402-2'-O)-methyltransferase [Candidatus Planktophila versatilis]ASY22114.1 16S rRNA (cytidine1402-2'-O)-methyltransferase [Candidatus Planktophila versatilis]